MDERKILTNGRVEDQSATKGPTNIEIKSSFVGRGMEMYKLIQAVRDPNLSIIQMSGEQGVGKTRLAEEVCTFVNAHKIIKDGVYYLDFKNA